MKILLVNKFHYRKGGSETYYFALADLLRQAGHEVCFFAMESPKNLPCSEEKYFVSHVEYNGPQGVLTQLKSAASLLYSREAKEKFTRLLGTEKPDIVHLNLVHRQITLSVVDACREKGIPVVFTQHDLICVCPNYTCLSSDGPCEECLKGHFWPCIRKRCVKGSRSKSILGAAEARLYRLRGSYNKIDCYIAPSAFYQSLLQKANFTRAPILHLTNFLPLDTEYRQQPVDACRELLYMGRLSPEKGLVTLLRAMVLCPGLRLKVAGEGSERSLLEKLAGELGLENRVTFAGFVQGETLKKLLYGCYAVVLPSEWYENGPYSVMEALAAGKPVVGSRIGGIPELVRDGETGFTFAAGQPKELAAVLGRLESLSPEEYDRLCQSSLEFARKHFDAQNYYHELLKIYGSLLPNKA